MSLKSVVIESLWLYPIKSLPGVEVEQLRFDAEGVRFDRCMVLVDEGGQFISQRSHPALRLLRLEWLERSILISTADGGKQVEVALTRPDTPVEMQVATVWKDTVPAQRVSVQADAFFSEYLGQKVSLLRADQGHLRFSKSGDAYAFADAYPLLVTNQASLDSIAASFGEPLSIQRFRPNIHISGLDAWQEESITTLTTMAGEIAMRSHCVRCKMVTLDWRGDGRHFPKLLKVLAQRHADVIFGVNASPTGLTKLVTGERLTAQF